MPPSKRKNRPHGNLSHVQDVNGWLLEKEGVGRSAWSQVSLEQVHAAGRKDTVLFEVTERTGSLYVSYRSLAIVAVRGGRALEILVLRSESVGHRDEETAEPRRSGDRPLQTPTFEGAIPKVVVPGEGHKKRAFDPARFVYR